ncbi:YjdF family protein [Actinocrispum wychmicini]|nr:YjdF family protein [Actinocrispum wychmicini]
MFTVYFDGQFWVGVLEVHDEDGVRAARHVFGPEPTNAELLQFACRGEFDRLSRLAHRSPAVSSEQRALSWKRELRNVDTPMVGTAAQRAMKAAVAARSVESKAARKDREAAEKDRRRTIARAKAKAKHRGR